MLLHVSAAVADGYKLTIDSDIGIKLSNLPENSWVRLNLNEYRDAWIPLDQRPAPPEAPSVGSPASIIRAWSSMAWDSNRGNLILWGGGHANYPGNEVYIWRASTLQWERASVPSEVTLARPDIDLFEAIDGPFNAPISAHTYDNSEFLPIVDRFITFGGAAFNTGRFFELVDRTRTGPYLWDPSRGNSNSVGGTSGSNVKPDIYSDVIGGSMWQNRHNLHPAYEGDLKPGLGGTYWINGATAYSNENGVDSLYIQVADSLYKYTIPNINDSSLDTYQRQGRYITRPFSGQGAGAFDPGRNIFLRSAGGQFTFWRLDNPGKNNENTLFRPTVTAGIFSFSSLKYYGMDFDPRRNQFLLWNGQGEVWSLIPPEDLELGTWTMSPLSPVASNSPNLPSGHTGILGKWKYAAALDVFLGAFDPREGQVWAYKPQDWQPTVAEKLPFIIEPASNRIFNLAEDISVLVDSFDSTVEDIEIFANGISIGQSTNTPYSFIWYYPEAGNYALEAVGRSTDGGTSTSPIINISVLDASNLPPEITLVSPSDGTEYTAGDSIDFTATAADADGSVTRVEFYQGLTKLGEDTTAPYNFTWANPAEGTYTLSATAFDDDGVSTSSTTVDITVITNTANVPPTVALIAPLDGTELFVGDSINFEATADDADGNVIRVEFYQGLAKLGEDTSAPYSYTWNNPAEGAYTLSIKAVDDGGAIASSLPVAVDVLADPNSNSIILQEGLDGYNGTRDSYLYEYHKSTNYGPISYIKEKPTGSRFRSLIGFAIFQSEGGPVPAGATITSATLSLYKSSYYDHNYKLHPLLASWLEDEVTWKRTQIGVAWSSEGATGAGSDFDALYDSEAAAQWDPGWVEFDVSGGVQAMSLGRANFGWIMEPAGGNNNTKKFRSSEYTGDTSLRPKLVIQYS
ncbi:MAG: hypothetical protein DRR42_11685, partial [Gammaproteobacteria bacterium]